MLLAMTAHPKATEGFRLRGCAANFVNARKLLMPMTFARRTAEENARALGYKEQTGIRGTCVARGKAKQNIAG
jgi:hypothetical protein